MATTPPSRSLGARELALLEAWEADRLRVVTLDDIQAGLGEAATRGAAKNMASRLRAKGFLASVGRGMYEVLPLSTLGVSAPSITAYLTGLRLRGVPFYLGFDTAAAHYGWYAEAFGRVTLGLRPITTRSLRSIDGTFVRVVQALPQVFEDGIVQDRWRGVQLALSTREQTVLDLVRKPALVDGYPGLLRVLQLAGTDPKLNRMRLVQVAATRSIRMQKRLGWLCERAGWIWTGDQLALLRRDWPRSHRATLGDTHNAAPGVWDNEWQLVINVPETQLIPAAGVR